MDDPPTASYEPKSPHITSPSISTAPPAFPDESILPPGPTMSDPASSSNSSRDVSPPKDTASMTVSTNVSGPSSALRRTLSSGSGDASREAKRLRFTTLPDEEKGMGLGLSDAGGSGDGSSKHGSNSLGLYGASEPGTPNFLETADQIRRTLSLASLDRLMTLSASSDRDKILAGVSRAGKDLVWRRKDEKQLFPRDVERALVLTIKRGLRSFILAFSVRAGVNLLLVIFRSFRRKRLRLAMIRHALFGAESFRFGAMIGTFTFLNTLTLHLLRLTPPLSYLRRRWKHGFLSRPSFGPPEREGPEGERRWQAAAAGAVGSLGLLWETRSRRRGVAQQMFVRGLQGAYNQYTPQYGIHIPHGDTLLFGLCCGQIMYAWLMNPETMPAEYNNWIQHASRVPKFAVLANRTAVNTKTVDTSLIQQAISAKSTTQRNREILYKYIEQLKSGFKPPSAVPCELVHPTVTSCPEANIRRFFDVFRFMLPVYSALHLIPMLVLRRHHFKRDPLRMLARVIWGITRSCSFLGIFVVIFHSWMCIRYQTIHQKLGGKWLQELMKRKQMFWFFGFSTCLSLFVEEKKRRAELAMYVLPRALESAWSSARKRAWVPIVPFGETILGAAAMAMVMDAYKHRPEALSGIVKRLMYQLVGPV
ncbi:hypothetical protein BD324DRAFT_616112 [Kockovaella imperatae]|uniref:Transmembrane protein 135 N-terminal domain-containing protein n=1 Tax=Kockovaella imperatae TaxID=4999 RepID=A0A1Y1USA0_9TREE|nr:hypothetical protein BD324DRAFT_616112 [Kockovaella imperatae]ORX40065.1 hypothetical protein BD324DRAFT_616112 [Kockovaella imperatae]